MKKVIKFSIKNVSLGVHKLILMSHQRRVGQRKWGKKPLPVENPPKINGKPASSGRVSCLLDRSAHYHPLYQSGWGREWRLSVCLPWIRYHIGKKRVQHRKWCFCLFIMGTAVRCVFSSWSRTRFMAAFISSLIFQRSTFRGEVSFIHEFPQNTWSAGGGGGR